MLCHILYVSYTTGDMLGRLFSLATFHELVDAFIVTVSIIFFAVPEGLDRAITIVLTYSVGKMKD